jgi:tetraspanin-18
LAVDKASFIQITKFSSLNEGLPIDNQIKGIIRELTEPTVIEQGAYILIAAGAFIFIISFLGYCGAIKESRVLLTAYGLFIIIIALLQIAAIVLATIYKNHAETHTQDFFQHTIRKYYTTKSQRDAVTLSWDFMMAEMHCCGVDNYEDFTKATEFVQYTREEGLGQVIPESCCVLADRVEAQQLFIPKDDNCITAPTTTNSYMNKGCYKTVYDMMISNLNIVIGVSVGVLAVQILGIIFAFCLCKAIGNDRDYHYKY